MSKVPYGVTAPEQEGLNYLAVEVSYGSTWINLNDGDMYKMSSDQTRDNITKSWRKITAQSAVLGGEYLIHAVPDMVVENVSVYIFGNSQSDLADNYWFLLELFEQLDYRIRWTTNEYREYWTCQLAESTSSRNQVWTHNQMATATFQVPRFPDVVRERVG